MDGRQFDDLSRSFSKSRRTVLGGSLAALGLALGSVDVQGKKKKKKCAKKCADGCCTSKHGKCIYPAQQSATQCGNGGEICRTNCEGQSPPPPGAETCGPENCQGGCCAGSACMQATDQTCGIGGAPCVPCDAQQDCFAGKCCGLSGHACAGDLECCLNRLCREGKCCSAYGVACSKDSDCCNPDTFVCSGGECLIKNGQPCEPLQRCQGNLPCPASGICGDVPEDCTTACAEKGHCEFLDCGGNLLCCDLGPCTSPPGERCNCLEGGNGCTAVEQ